MSDGDLKVENCAVAVVGGGTAGLALASELKRRKIGKVVVLERESEAGGVPRHCGHFPFGVTEYKRLLKGPDYARRNRELAASRGVEVRTGTTATALLPDGIVEALGPEGRYRLNAERVALCTGVRESSRAQRFIGGDRPGGVISTGALQSLVYLKGLKPFERPVVLGSELVSFSAIRTCAHLGIKLQAMVEENDRIVGRRILQPYLGMKGIPLFSGANDTRIVGRNKVKALEITDRAGVRRKIETDGVIVSGRFRPEAALLHGSHLEVDSGTGGPVIDQFARCSDPSYFAAGNLLRPAETSGYCWREGIATAGCIADDIQGLMSEDVPSLSVVPADPAIRFVVPQRIRRTTKPGGKARFYIGLNAPCDGRLTATAGERVLWQQHLSARPVRRIETPLFSLPDTGDIGQIEFAFEDGSG